MCTPSPSVTLYGTTQISTVHQVTETTVTTKYGDAWASYTVFNTQECDAFGCRNVQKTSSVMATPSWTEPVQTVFDKTTVVTSIVPQKTLYYPCPTTDNAPAPSPTTSTARMEDVETFTSIKSSARSQAQDTQPAPSSSVNLGEGVFTLTEGGTTMTSTALTHAPTTDETATAALTEDTMMTITSTSNGGTSTWLATVSGTRPISTSGSSSTHLSSSPSPSSDTNAAAATSSSKSSSSHGPLIGGIIGGIVALILLCAVITFLRRARSARDDGRSLTTTEDYWERRFQAIEAGVDEKDDGRSEVSGKRLRLTLDLGSKVLSLRTARMSGISSYLFPRPGTRQSEKRMSIGTIDFSRPSILNRESKRFSRSARSASGGDKSESQGDLVEPMPSSHIVVINDDDDQGDGNGRKGMEWMRTEELEDAQGVRVEDNGGYPAIALHRLSRMAPTREGQSGMGYIQPGSRIPPAPSNARRSSRQLTPPKAPPAPPPAPPVTSPVVPKRPFSSHRQSQGKFVPELSLARAAVTPSLWVDEDAYDEFTRGESRFSPDSEAPYGGIEPGTALTTDERESVLIPPDRARMGSEGSLERSAVTPRLPHIPHLAHGVDSGVSPSSWT